MVYCYPEMWQHYCRSSMWLWCYRDGELVKILAQFFRLFQMHFEVAWHMGSITMLCRDHWRPSKLARIFHKLQSQEAAIPWWLIYLNPSVQLLTGLLCRQFFPFCGVCKITFQLSQHDYKQSSHHTVLCHKSCTLSSPSWWTYQNFWPWKDYTYFYFWQSLC